MRQGEKGFTIIELIMVIGLVALITGAANAAIFQVVKGSERSNNHITAVRQVQNAGHWISQDVRSSQEIFTEDLTPPNFLIITWVDWDDNSYQVVYTLEDVPGTTTKRLVRSESINGGDPEVNVIAQYIDPDPEKTKCEVANGKFTLTITATVGTGSLAGTETRVFEVLPRPD